MANLITLTRFILLFVLVALAYRIEPWLRMLCFPLVIFIFLADGIDGYVARKLNETSQFGAVFDIAIDRVVENVLWLVLADLDLIPVWIAIVFITRGFLVDSIRSKAIERGQTPFDMIKSPLGTWLVAGRFMRAFYGAVKGVSFSALLLIHALHGLAPEFFASWEDPLSTFTAVFVYIAVVLCLLRAFPVFLEFGLGFAGKSKNMSDDAG